MPPPPIFKGFRQALQKTKPEAIKKLVQQASPVMKSLKLGTPGAMQPTWTKTASGLRRAVEAVKDVEYAGLTSKQISMKTKRGLHQKPGNIAGPILPGTSDAKLRKMKEQAAADAAREAARAASRRAARGPTPSTSRAATTPAKPPKAAKLSRAIESELGRIDAALDGLQSSASWTGNDHVRNKQLKARRAALEKKHGIKPRRF